jgi:hypothetical protein
MSANAAHWLVPLLLAAASAAQHTMVPRWDPPRDQLGNATARLRLALAGSKAQANGRFVGEARVAAEQGSVDATKFEGGWGDGIVLAKVGPTDFAVTTNAIASRKGKAKWAAVRGKTAFRVVPAELFEALADSGCTVLHRDVGMIEDRPVEFTTLRLPDDAAKVLLAGLQVPGPSSSYKSSIERTLRAKNQSHARAAVDVIVAFDPVAKSVRELRIRLDVLDCRLAPDGRETDVDADAVPTSFADGMPVHAFKRQMSVTWRIGFSDLGASKPPPLDDSVKEALGLIPPKPKAKPQKKAPVPPKAAPAQAAPAKR